MRYRHPKDSPFEMKLIAALIVVILTLLSLRALMGQDPFIVEGEDTFGGRVERRAAMTDDDDTTLTIPQSIVRFTGIGVLNNPTSNTMQGLSYDPINDITYRTPLDEWPGTGGGGGGGDHGGLGGLGDDDHTQYVLRTDAVETLTTNMAVGEAPVGVGGNAMSGTDIATQSELDAHDALATAHHNDLSTTAPLFNTGEQVGLDPSLLTEDDTASSESLLTIELPGGALRTIKIKDLDIDTVGGIGGPGNARAVRAFNSTDISIPNNTLTNLTFDSESYDSDSFHSVSTNTHQFTAPVDGYYLLTGGVQWAFNSVGVRSLFINVEGAALAQSRIGTDPGVFGANVATVHHLSAGEVATLTVLQNSGAALNVQSFGIWTPHFSMTLLPDGHDAVVVVTDDHDYILQSGQTLTLDAVHMTDDLEGSTLIYDLVGSDTNTGATNPTAAATASTGAAWVDPTNIFASDDSRAVSTISASGFSQQLLADALGFAIPTGSAIRGVQVDIERHGSNAGGGWPGTDGTIRDFAVQLLLAGSLSGDNKAEGSPYWPGTTTGDTVKTYGGPTDLWGLALTAADVNDADFGAVLVASNSNPSSAREARVDHMTMTVYYENNGIEYYQAVNTAENNSLDIGVGNASQVGGKTALRISPDGKAELVSSLGYGTTDPDRVLHIIDAAPFKWENATNDGFEIVQISPLIWGWNGLQGGMEFRLQNSDFNVSQGDLSVPLGAITESGNAVPNATDGLDFFAQTSLADPGFDALMGWDDDDTQFEILAPASLATDTNPTTESLVPYVHPSTGLAKWTRINDIAGAVSGDGGIDLTTKGDIHVSNGSSQQALAVGTNRQVVVADSAQTLGLKYAWYLTNLAAFSGAIDASNDYIGIYDNSDSQDEKIAVRDFRDAMPAPLQTQVWLSANQSIANLTQTAIQWDTEDFDDDGMWVIGSPTKLTCVTAGRYEVSARLRVRESSTTGLRNLRIIHYNSSDVQQAQVGQSSMDGLANPTIIISPTIVDLVAGDYLSVEFFHNQGGNINVGGNSGTLRDSLVLVTRVGP